MEKFTPQTVKDKNSFERERREHVLFIYSLDHWVPLGSIIALIDGGYIVLPSRKNMVIALRTTQFA